MFIVGQSKDRGLRVQRSAAESNRTALRKKSSSQQAYSDFSSNADRRNSGSAKGARRRRGLMVKDFGLYCNDALDRVGDKTIFFSLLQNPRHPAQVTDRSNHYSRFNHNRGYLVTASWYFFERTLCC